MTFRSDWRRCMLRTCLCSLAGAGVGFFVAFVLVGIASGGGRTSASDTTFVSIFLGALLAVGGAIAGAVIGGAADLLHYLRRRDQAQSAAQGQGGQGGQPPLRADLD